MTNGHWQEVPKGGSKNSEEFAEESVFDARIYSTGTDLVFRNEIWDIESWNLRNFTLLIFTLFKFTILTIPHNK